MRSTPILVIARFGSTIQSQELIMCLIMVERIIPTLIGKIYHNKSEVSTAIRSIPDFEVYKKVK